MAAPASLTSVSRYVCPYCGRRIITPGKMANHIAARHAG